MDYPNNSVYPKTKYAPKGGSITVESEHHEKQIGAGWSDNPPLVTATAPLAPPLSGSSSETETASTRPVVTSRGRGR